MAIYMAFKFVTRSLHVRGSRFQAPIAVGCYSYFYRLDLNWLITTISGLRFGVRESISLIILVSFGFRRIINSFFPIISFTTAPLPIDF